MAHTTRLKSRALDLDSVFTVPRMESVWKDTVRRGLREQAILDLHDHLDFHRSLQEYVVALRQEILEGTYKPRRPLVVRTEKAWGIPRRLQQPAPEDALVLQTLVEEISSTIEAKQPSKSAYYSRSHALPKSVADVDESFPYVWWELWPAFQSRIYDFTRRFDYVVITDIANYYDSIPLVQLRNTLASFGDFRESLLDFLFYMLESFVWRPDYLPPSGVGLPQIDFDAPRLLAHAFLYEADSLLKNRTGDNFVRWMDDLDIGARSISEARKLLGELDQLLCSRGVRLNAGKTKIMDARTATKHFWLQENRRLTILDSLIKSRIERGSRPTRETAALQKYFHRFWKSPREGSWDKVLKRYYTLAGRVSASFLVRHTQEVLANMPSLRGTVFRYYEHLGYLWMRYRHVENYLESGYCQDDASLFEAVHLLIKWSVPWKGPAHGRIVRLAKRLAAKSECGRIASYWLMGKYGTRSEVVDLLRSTQSMWTRSPTLARQAASLLPRLLRSPSDRKWLMNTVVSTGHVDAIRVVAHCVQLRSLTTFG